MVSSSSASRPWARRSTNSASRWLTTAFQLALRWPSASVPEISRSARSNCPSMSASAVRAALRCHRWAGWRSSSASTPSASSSTVHPGAISEHPEGLQSVVVAGENPLLVADLLAQCNQPLALGDAVAARERLWSLDRDPLALESERRGSRGRRSAARSPPPARPSGPCARARDRRARAAASRASSMTRVRLSCSPAAARARSNSGTRAGSVLARAQANLPPYASAARASWSERPACSASVAARRSARFASCAVARSALDLAEREQQLAGPVGLTRSGRVEDAKRARVVTGRLLVTVLRGGPVTSELGVVDRLVRERDPGFEVVVSELCEVRLRISRVEHLERFGDRAMQAQPPRSRELLVQRVPDQDVREAEASARLGNAAHQPRGRRLLESREELVLLEPTDPPEQIGVELPADDGSQRQDLAGSAPTGAEAAGRSPPLRPPGWGACPGPPHASPRTQAAARSPWRTGGSPVSPTGPPLPARPPAHDPWSARAAATCRTRSAPSARAGARPVRATARAAPPQAPVRPPCRDRSRRSGSARRPS